jgi:hypothetical protein
MTHHRTRILAATGLAAVAALIVTKDTDSEEER